MRYLVSLVAGCSLALWIVASAAHAGTAEDCQQTQNLDLLIRACSEIIRADARAAWAFNNRGLAHNRKGNYDRAIADLSEAIRLDPGFAHAFNNRGFAYNNKGAYEQAIVDLTEAIRLNPHFASAFNNRGISYNNKTVYDRAIKDFSEAIRLSPRFAVAYLNRGLAHLRKGDLDQAVADLSKSIELDSTYVMAFSRRGEAFEAKGDRGRALDDYRSALAMPARTQLDRDEQTETRRRLTVLQAAPPTSPTPLIDFTRIDPPSTAPPLARRVALVIGNASYSIGPLQNPSNDASAVAKALRDTLKFDKVILKLNLEAEGFRAALREFSRETAGAGLGLVYFAGHGTEVGGRNFLIPVDAVLAKAADLDLEAIALDSVLSQLAGITTLKLVILDACRNNLFPLAGAQRSASRGLARIEPEENTLVFYAAKDGTTANDGVGRHHSPFTEALLKHIATRGLEIRFLLGEVRDDVMAATGRAQQPYVYGTLGRTKIYLRP